jgi:hypothetical protein
MDVLNQHESGYLTLYRKFRYFVRVNVLERARLIAILVTRVWDQKLTAIGSNDTNISKSGFLFNVQYCWAFSDLEFMSAARLASEKHAVAVIVCDGLPYCEREIVNLSRPSCESCTKQTLRNCSAYGLEPILLSDHITVEVRESAILSAKGELSSLLNYKDEGVPIGVIAKRNHEHFMKGDYEPTGIHEALFRRCYEASYLLSRASAAISKLYPDRNVVTANGKFCQTAIPAAWARKYGNNYFSYEVFGQGNGVIVDKNRASMEQNVDSVWDGIRHTALSKEESDRLYRSFELQNKSLSSAFQLWDESRIDSESEIINSLGLDVTKKIIACYPNVAWDSTCMGLNGVCESITSWLLAMVEFAKMNSDIQVIIRAHPGEVKVPSLLKSSATICDTLRYRVNDIPSNIFLVEPENQISSYGLASIADANLVWNGTIGLELCLRGIKPIVVADAYYSKKGFTLDFLNLEEMLSALLCLDEKLVISEDEIRLVELFSFHIRFYRKFNPPYYNGNRASNFHFGNLRRGKNIALDNIVDYFLDKRSYMNIGDFKFE